LTFHFYLFTSTNKPLNRSFGDINEKQTRKALKQNMPHIFGRNPVIEALKNNQPIEKIYIHHGAHGENINHIYKLARSHKTPVTKIDSPKIKQIAGNVNHQGVIALISSIPTLTVDELLRSLQSGKNFPCLVLLDRINDPHNMGAIIRSGEVLGASGIIYPTRENVPLTETVVKASAGAAFKIPICKSENLTKTIQQLKENDFWIYGTSVDADNIIWEVDFKRNCAIIIGSEEKGIRPLVKKHCDILFAIPQIGETESLNASVAAGIILAEIARQKQKSTQSN
jgi:23S rRNA (guanosine2251-2'-O)-methyltransferase